VKIALIVEYLHARGGTQRQALELARALQAAGHEVEVVAKVWDRDACFPELARSLRIASVQRVSGAAMDRASALGRAPAGLRAMGRRVGAGYVLNYWCMRRSAAQLAPLVRDAALRCDVLNPHDFGPAAWAAAEAGAHLGKPVVWQCNDPLLRWDAGRGVGTMVRNWVLDEDRRRVRHVDAVTVLDRRVGGVVQRRYGSAPILVRSGVDVEWFARRPERSVSRAQFGLPADSRVALVLALLNSPHRRVEDAVAAHARGPNDVILLLACPAAASTGYALRVRRAVEASRARDRIVWLRRPLRDDEELRGLLAAADLLIFPNVHQTWGLAAIEAAAAGLPVVISDGAGASEVFEDGVTARIYQGGDVVSLVDALACLWSSASHRRDLGSRASAMVQRSLSWRTYAAAMSDVFATAVRSSRARGPYPGVGS
jgi:glycosyltransferase involved in cell wall biosynthesis